MSLPRRDEKFLKAIGQRLRQIRKKRGLSQQYVYTDTDINIGRLERGERNFSIITLGLLCNYYQVALEDFFKGLGIDDERIWG